MIEKAKALVDGGSKAGEVAVKLFPGMQARSMDNAASSSVHAAMTDIDDIMAWVKKTDMPDEIRTAMLNYVFEKRGSDQRVAQCLTYAAPQIDESADADSLDQEWLDYWRMHAEKARDEEVQAIWGAILAGEVNNAGSVSKRAMSILADMEKRDADAFVSLCSCSMGGEMGNGETAEPQPMLIEPGERFAQNPMDIARLQSLGLIDFSLGIGMRTTQTTSCIPGQLFQIADTTYILVGNEKSQFTMVRYPFTDYGLQIAKYCSLGTGQGFDAGMVEHWKSLGFTVGRVFEWLIDGQVKYQIV